MKDQLSRSDKPSLLFLVISVSLSVSFATPVFAFVPQVTDVVVWNSGGDTFLNVTVYHTPETSLHHVDEIEVVVDGNIQSFPVEVQPTTTFTVPCNLGPIEGTPSATVRAHCTVDGWSSGSEPLEIALGPEKHLYIGMSGILTSCTQLGTFPPAFWTVPFASRSPDLSPTSVHQEIILSDPDPETGVANLVVPAASFVGVEHAFYDEGSKLWYKTSVSIDADGYGWLFTGTGTTPVLGDVDCYTYGDNSGVYWGPESLSAGELAADSGGLPDPGSDGVAGTDDDGFGDGLTDPAGSSILYLLSRLTTMYWDGTMWRELLSSLWPQVLTTGTAYHIVIEPESEIDGVNSTEVGQPCEFLAGLDHTGQDVDWGHPKWNAYVTYVCIWSVLDTPTVLGDLDVMFQLVEKKVREDCVIADINCDEVVDIFDVVTCAKAFGTEDEGPGPDGVCDTADDKPVADPKFDAKADINPDGVIDIFDVVKIAKDFGKALTPGEPPPHGPW